MTYREQVADRANHAIKTSGVKGIIVPTYCARPCYCEFKATPDGIWGRIKTQWYCLNFDTTYIDTLLKSNGF